MNNLDLALSRTWAEINLDELAHNVITLRKVLSPSAKFLGVVKANAYGHGMTQCARVLASNGADWLAVATIPEAVTLRQSGIKLPILCLGQTRPELASLMAEHNITQAVGDLSNAQALSAQARNLHANIRIHVKIDTGMSRTGFYWPDDYESKQRVARDILTACSLPGLVPEGLFTHFADADEPNYSHLQIRRFNDARGTLAELGRTFNITHAAASVAVLNYPEAHFDMGRFGLVLYGYESTDTGNENAKLDLHPVMTLKSRITAVRHLPAGTTISYGRTYTLKRDSIIAVLPIGYADGLPRVLSNNFNVKINGTLCPNVGRVCMDMTMVDVTDIPNVEAGYIATVWDGELIPPAAKNAHTIIHEVVCMPSSRVPRVFIQGGKMSV